MAIRSFNEVISLSNKEIYQSIIETEKELFDLRFNKTTGQSFKAHEIRMAKCKIAQLKTLLTARLNEVEQKRSNITETFIDKTI